MVTSGNAHLTVEHPPAPKAGPLVTVEVGCLLTRAFGSVRRKFTNVAGQVNSSLGNESTTCPRASQRNLRLAERCPRVHVASPWEERGGGEARVLRRGKDYWRCADIPEINSWVWHCSEERAEVCHFLTRFKCAARSGPAPGLGKGRRSQWTERGQPWRRAELWSWLWRCSVSTGQVIFSLSFPRLQSWDDDATLFRTVLGDSQVNRDVVIINESVNLLVQCCSSVIAHSTLNMVLRWPYETYAVVILTSLYVF